MNGTTRRGVAGRTPIPLDSLQQYNPNRPGALEAIWQPFYDFQAIPTGTTQLLFFQVPYGQSAKTYQDTNMTNAGMFPAPTMFLCVGVQVVFMAGVTVSQSGASGTRALNQWVDTVAVNNSGWLEFLIGSKTYLRDAPLGKFAPNFSIAGAAAVSFVDSDLAAGGQVDAQFARAVGRYYEVTPFLIPQTQNFSVSLNYAGAGVTLTATGRIGLILDGFYYRQSQ